MNSIDRKKQNYFPLRSEPENLNPKSNYVENQDKLVSNLSQSIFHGNRLHSPELDDPYYFNQKSQGPDHFRPGFDSSIADRKEFKRPELNLKLPIKVETLNEKSFDYKNTKRGEISFSDLETISKKQIHKVKKNQPVLTTIHELNGEKFEGYMLDGKRQGWGISIHPDGEKYEGYFAEDRAEGDGVLTLSDGTKYIGTFKNDEFHGTGKLIFANGETYEGNFSEGKRHGYGQSNFPNIGHYVGNYENDIQNGLGKLVLNSGEKYVGEFIAGKPEGMMLCTFPDGTTFEGLVIDRVPIGVGVLTLPNACKYEGKFVDGRYQNSNTGQDLSFTCIGALISHLRGSLKGIFNFSINQSPFLIKINSIFINDLV